MDNECNGYVGNSINYFIITPVRNEELMLPSIAGDIANQSIRPILWIIVDDYSTDKTGSIIKELEKRFSWIKGVRNNYEDDKTYAHERYARIVRLGINIAQIICAKSGLDYCFIALVDADVRLKYTYFEKIFDQFKSTSRLGIASGFVYEKGQSLQKLSLENRTPRGCSLVFRRECYQIIGDFPGHAASIIKAKNRNWQVKTIESLKVVHRRLSGSGAKYFFSAGEYAYFMNYHPINAFLTGLHMTIMGSSLNGFYYLKGYLSGFISRKEKSVDDELTTYYWHSFNRLLHRLF